MPGRKGQIRRAPKPEAVPATREFTDSLGPSACQRPNGRRFGSPFGTRLPTKAPRHFGLRRRQAQRSLRLSNRATGSIHGNLLGFNLLRPATARQPRASFGQGATCTPATIEQYYRNAGAG